MSDPLERVEKELKPLLRTLETLQLIGRYLNPPELAGVLESIGSPVGGTDGGTDPRKSAPAPRQ